MTSTDGVSGAGAANLASVVGDPGMIDLSPEGLIAFCAQQLGEVNSEISDQMKAQQLALKQRQALHGALSVLNGFGTDGPQTPEDMQKCVEAIKNAKAQLGPDDPVARQLDEFLTKMESDYKYVTPQALTADQQIQLQAAQQNGDQATVATLTKTQEGSFSAPDKANKQWTGTTQALT
ncbi:MAG: hypothetical protein JOZ69_16145, partial [Myxococcales bacterium]|nr:hypothetical protein [Myxococcales bacterium]